MLNNKIVGAKIMFLSIPSKYFYAKCLLFCIFSHFQESFLKTGLYFLDIFFICNVDQQWQKPYASWPP